MIRLCPVGVYRPLLPWILPGLVLTDKASQTWLVLTDIACRARLVSGERVLTYIEGCKRPNSKVPDRANVLTTIVAAIEGRF